MPVFAGRESDREEAAVLPSLSDPSRMLEKRLGDVDLVVWYPTSESRLAAFHVLSDTVLLLGGSTPERRAFSCFGERRRVYLLGDGESLPARIPPA